MRGYVETLPGTHLGETDCIDCGTVVLAVPAYANNARCAECGQGHYGAEPPSLFPNWTGRSTAAPRTRPVRAARPAPVEQALRQWCAYCPRECGWTANLSSADDIWPAIKLHWKTIHDPNGWVSGIRGGGEARYRASRGARPTRRSP